MRSLVWIALLVIQVAVAHAQSGSVYVCPMHADVQSDKPGNCSRCGMTLIESRGDDFREFPIAVETMPKPAVAGADMRLRLSVFDPTSGQLVRDFERVHEKLLHLFIVSEDLSYLDHLHPQLDSDGRFSLLVRLPKEGHYQVIADFVPRGGIPQMVQRPLLTQGHRAGLASAHLVDTGVRQFTSDGVTLELESAPRIVGAASEITVRATGRTLEPYLGTIAHLLLVSEDLSEVVHAHSDLDGNRLRFDVHFPRPGRYRLWVQVQASGKVITAPFVITADRPETPFLSR